MLSVFGGTQYRVIAINIPNYIVNTDTSGKFSFAVSNLREVKFAIAVASDGYTAYVDRIYNNEVVITVYKDVNTPVISGNNICSISIIVFGL